MSSSLMLSIVHNVDEVVEHESCLDDTCLKYS